jgi:hypothetical protein
MYKPYHTGVALTCNIDAKGKRLRLILGIIELAAALVLLFLWALPRGGWLPWTLSIGLICLGLFGIFEARAGWCVVRAMGIKTRI